jgi:predicted kinase
VIEARLLQIGLRALELGNNVVIDYGLWGRDERSALRQAAADLGAMVEMRYFELTNRISLQNDESALRAGANDVVQTSSTWVTNGGMKTMSNGPSPMTWYAIETSPLLV